jgi:hypothetical protein
MTTAVRWISGITAALVLVQAMLIGQALYVNGMTTVALHGWLGSGSFAAAIMLVVLTLVAVQRKEVSRLTLGLGLMVVLLMIAQLGLGYMGRRNGQAAALHIPNGVLITGLLFALVTTTFATATRADQVDQADHGPARAHLTK